MAKKTKAAPQTPSKFQAVIAVIKYFEDHPDGSNDDAVAALKKQGLKISPRYVAQIKSKAKLDAKSSEPRRARTKTKKSSKPAKSPKSKVTSEVPIVDADAVVQAAKFIDSMGGVQQARDALNAAEKVIRTVHGERS